MLEQMLKYHESPTADDFTHRVIARVRHQKRVRRFILTVFGLLGAVFGAYGMLILADPISRIMTEMPVLQISVVLVAAAGFMVWLLQDELSTMT